QQSLQQSLQQQSLQQSLHQLLQQWLQQPLWCPCQFACADAESVPTVKTQQSAIASPAMSDSKIRRMFVIFLSLETSWR
ncbi:MAG: hypothetical protein J2P36_31545, partial [Ktedonobacteraceae bacterium]|nr:hypothetical protein [Ktedonobacteraceae bacterium]